MSNVKQLSPRSPGSNDWRTRIEPIDFEGMGPCFYEVGPMRAPRAGEFYLSGAIPAAYRAGADLPSHYTYHIVRPTYFAISVKRWVRGKEARMSNIPPLSTVQQPTMDDSEKGDES